ncbi:hypothetical protein HAX54_003618 [Datura stramonium]|uniref:Uncharacterized protein n=1 Tax=Datura stramonium TaxID=4076 RepID=A0ABS8WUP8_DATST|nr:hypothetical protein [Datura stramonium]
MAPCHDSSDNTTCRTVTSATLAPYESLHAQIDDMEAQMDERLKDLIGLDLAKFAAEFTNIQADILNRRKFPREGDEDDAKSQRRKHRKMKQEQAKFCEAPRLSRAKEDMRVKKLRDHVEESSRLAHRVIDQTSGATVSLDL